MSRSICEAKWDLHHFNFRLSHCLDIPILPLKIRGRLSIHELFDIDAVRLCGCGAAGIAASVHSQGGPVGGVLRVDPYPLGATLDVEKVEQLRQNLRVEE